MKKVYVLTDDGLLQIMPLKDFLYTENCVELTKEEYEWLSNMEKQERKLYYEVMGD